MAKMSFRNSEKCKYREKENGEQGEGRRERGEERVGRCIKWNIFWNT